MKRRSFLSLAVAAILPMWAKKTTPAASTSCEFERMFGPKDGSPFKLLRTRNARPLFGHPAGTVIIRDMGWWPSQYPNRPVSVVIQKVSELEEKIGAKSWPLADWGGGWKMLIGED